MKRSICLLLVIALLTGMMPMTAWAEENSSIANGTCGEDLTWSLDQEGTLTVSGTGAMEDYYSQEENNSSSPWAEYINQIESVILEDGVTSIGSGAFYHCENLKEIEFPEGLTSVGEYAFEECSDLADVYYAGTEDAWTAVAVGENNKYLSESEIHCADMTVNEPDSHVHNYSDIVTAPTCTEQGYTTHACDCGDSYTDCYVNSVGHTYGAWYETKAATVTEVGEERRDCSGCDHYETRSTDKLPSGNSCGENLTWTLDEEGTLIISGTGNMYDYDDDESPWSSESHIQKVIIEDGVTSIGAAAFDSCKNLRQFSIPDSVIEIGDHSFYGCSNLKELIIPEGVTKIGDWALLGCSGLVNLTIPNSVTEIGNSVFSDCSNLETVTLPDSITGITSNMFRDCKNLHSIEIPSSVQYIDDRAFQGCASLTSITIPDSVNRLCGVIFAECNNLKSVFFEGDAPKFADNTFEDFSATIYYPNGNVTWTADVLQNYGGSITWMQMGEDGDIPTNPHKHSYKADVTEPTCTEQGYTTYACDCGDSYMDSYVDATGHRYGDWYETKAPTQKEEGTERRDCTDCDTYETRGTDKLSGFEGISGTCGENLTWVLTATGSLEISGNGAMVEYTSPGDVPWHEYGENIIQLIIGENVESLSRYAFYNCVALEKIIYNSRSIVDFPRNSLWYDNNAFHNAGIASDGIELVIGANVTKIPANLFNPTNGLYSPNIKSITFEEGSNCKTIGEYAFAFCGAIENVSFSASINSIGSYAFYRCEKLNNVLFPKSSMADIGDYTFANCVSINNIVLSGDIGEYAFQGCSNLTKVELLDSVTSIGWHAFENCSNISGLTIPESIVSIGSGAFSGCSSLTTAGPIGSGYSIEFGWMNTIPDNAFSWLTSLNSVEIPETVTTIGKQAFCGTGLKRIDFPDSVKSIGVSAFYSCTNLADIEIPASLVTLSNSAFEGCTAVETIYFNATAMEDLSSPNYVFDSVGQKSNGVTVIFGADVPRVPAFLFCPDVDLNNREYAPKITKVLFAEGSACTTIGEFAFALCGRIEWFMMPKSLTSIEHWAFYLASVQNIDLEDVPSWCGVSFDHYSVPMSSTDLYVNGQNVTELVIPAGVTNIGSSTFQSCTGLQSITIPESVAEIGGSAFSGCTALTKICLNAAALADKSTGYGYAFSSAGKNSNGITVIIGKSVTRIPANLFSMDSYDSDRGYSPNIKSVIFEDGSICGSIGDYAFSRCAGLEHIVIGERVKEIGYNAFSNCSSLTNVTIPNSGTFMEQSVFSGCTNLISAGPIGGGYSIEFGWTDEIPNYAFMDCRNLTSVTIPESVTNIGINVFYGCDRLVGIFVEEGNPAYSSNATGFLFNKDQTKLIQAPGAISGSYVIPDSVTTIGGYAFSSCKSLTSVTIPDSVKSIGDYVFYSCDSLTSVTIGDSVTTIGGYAFGHCDSLTSVTIGDSVTTIGNFAFYYCDSLTSVTIGDSVTTIGDYAFNGCDRLTDVYYGGSEEEWAEISIGSNNECLTNATIHYNSTGLDSGNTGNGYIRYFYSWDKENLIAYFGSDPEENPLNFGSQVTEETDTSFIANVDELVGTYVLVETKPRTDGMLLPDTLVSIKPLESVGIGTVTAISTTDGTITIDGVTYSYTFAFMEIAPEVGDYVRYYIDGGKLLSIDAIEPEEGFLIKWDLATDEITIRKSDDTGTETTYIFDGYTDQTSVDFLNAWNLYTEVYEDVTATVRFIADNNYVYRIDGEISRKFDFNEKIYRADYLLSDAGHNLDFYIRFINQYSPSQMILSVNELSSMNELWSAVTVTLDTFADGDAYAKYKFEQADIYETILLNALEVSIDSGSTVSWAKETVKETEKTTKEIVKNVQRILELKDDLDITEYPALDTMTLEQKMMLKDALTDELKDGPYTGCIFAMSDASDLLDSIMKVATTVKDFVTTILIYEKLAELTDAMATVLDEMYAKTPDDADHWAMRDALTFCSQMIKETREEQFNEMAILRSGLFASETVLEKGVSYIWGKVMDMAKAANPELRILLFGYKAGRTLANVLCDVDDLSEQIFKLNAVNQYGAVLTSATSTLVNRYRQNRSVVNAEALLSALSLQFSLACEDCNIAYAYADVIDDAMLYKIEAFIAEQTGKTDEIAKTDNLKNYATNRKNDFHNFSVEADTYWILELKQDYPELYPEYTDRLGEDTNIDDALVVPITSSYEIKCPVDVFVYDRNGDLLVDLSKNMSYVSDYLLAFMANNHKYIDLYNDQEYRIVCVGYDDGSMNIGISEYRGSEKIRTAFFNDLAVRDEIEYETLTKTNPLDDLIHTVVCDGSVINADFDSNIQMDTSEHAHVGGTATCTQKAVCTVCGTSYGELASHDYETSWSQGDANGHWHECKNCSAHDTQVKHTPGAAATETTAQTCTECGYVIAPATGHATHTAGSKWFSDGNSHWHKCTGCNEKLDVTTHSGGTATCTKKAVCTVCGVAYGELAAHDYETKWNQGNSSGHWHECKNCSAHSTPVKHTPGNAATTTTAETCTVCGYVITPALGHTCTAGSQWYSNGTYHWHLCTSCGAWVNTASHNYSSDADATCNVCSYIRTVDVAEATEAADETVAETEETEATEETVAETEAGTEAIGEENDIFFSDDAVEDSDSSDGSNVLLTVLGVLILVSLAAVVGLLIYKKRLKN